MLPFVPPPIARIKANEEKRMRTDIEIAQATPMEPIGKIAEIAGIAPEYLE